MVHKVKKPQVCRFTYSAILRKWSDSDPVILNDRLAKIRFCAATKVNELSNACLILLPICFIYLFVYLMIAIMS